jgi:hypothetical protein
MNRISLADALAAGDLEPFIQQAESDGVGPIEGSKFDTMLGSIIVPRPEGQTSHSSAHDLKRGK